MTKNNITAMLIIFVAVLFFQGPFKQTPLYKKLGGTPPSQKALPSATQEETTAAIPPQLSDSTLATASDSLDVIDTTQEVIAPEIFDTIHIETKLLKLAISEKGAEIISVELKNYTYGKQHPRAGELIQLLADSTRGIAGSAINGQDLRDTKFSYDSDASSTLTARFTTMVDGTPVTKEYCFADSTYYIDLNLTSPLLAKGNKTLVSLFLDAGIDETEAKDGMSSRYSMRTVTLNDGKKTTKVTGKKIETVTKNNGYRWSALSSKYFTIATILSPQLPANVEITSWVINLSKKIGGNNLNQSLTILQELRTDNNTYTLFLGPNERSALAMGGVGLEKNLFRGYTWFFFANVWFPKLCEIVLWLLVLFGGIFKDYGIAIILITLLLKIATFPLSQSSMKSMSSMQELKPKLDKLQAKHKGNPQLLQKKTMELYQEEGVNPLASLGGCLPMLLQFPIMISLFLVLRKAIELRGETTFLVPWLSDLSQAEALFQLPFVIPLINTNNFALLPLLSGVLMYFQNKATMKDPAQRQMMILMPFMMAFMFYTMPSGLNLYFVVSSLLQIAQQRYMDHKKKLNAAQPVVMTKDGKIA